MQMAKSSLFHLCKEALWNESKLSGQPYTPPTYEQDGFVHLTEDPKLLLTVANHFYADDPVENTWIVLVISADKIQKNLKFEAAAPVGNKSSDGLAQESQDKALPLFPHLYAAILPEYVINVLKVERDNKTGRFLQIEGLER